MRKLSGLNKRCAQTILYKGYLPDIYIIKRKEEEKAAAAAAGTSKATK
jgi:hypothetical protein